MKGIVVKFDPKKGFGFIKANDLTKDAFFHISSVEGKKTLAPGQKVNFKVSSSARGLTATHIVPSGRALAPFIIFSILSIASGLGIAYLLKQYSITGKPLYFITINIITLSFFLIDKLMAKLNKLRIPEKKLLLLALIGGSPASLVGQFIFRHKTEKKPFKLAMWAIIFVQIGIAGYLIR
jgi:uncharacterized membrane protein YsdA (DUF1294 family)/cold shock CspA family protein